MQRVKPEQLIQAVTESKMHQKRMSAKLVAAKRREEREKRPMMKRPVTPPNFVALDADEELKLSDFMAVSWRESYCFDFWKF